MGSIFAKNDPIRDFGSFGFCHLPSCKIFLVAASSSASPAENTIQCERSCKEVGKCNRFIGVQICMIKVNKIGEDSQN